MKDKKFQYVFRPTVHSDQYGNATCSYVQNYSQSKFGIAPKNMPKGILGAALDLFKPRRSVPGT